MTFNKGVTATYPTMDVDRFSLSILVQAPNGLHDLFCQLIETRLRMRQLTSDFARFSTPSLTLASMRSLTVLPSGKECRSCTRGSRNRVRELWGGWSGRGAGAWYAAIQPPQAECPTTMTRYQHLYFWLDEFAEGDLPWVTPTVRTP